MGSFSEGMRMGQSAYQQVLDNAQREKEFALKEAEAGRAAEEFARRKVEWARNDSDYEATQADIQALTRPNAGNYSITDTTGGLGLKYKPQAMSAPETDLGTEAYGLSAPAAPRLSAPKGGYTANALPEGADAEAILGRMALRKGDTEGFRKSQDRTKQFKGEAETRKFIDDLKSMYELATSPDAAPEAKEAWARAAAPHMQMVSGFKGLDFDGRVNPVTGRMEIVPYDGGAPKAVSFEEAAPYLLASRQLTSKYGDTEKALAALHNMSNEQRAAVMEGTKFRVGLKKLSADTIEKEYANNTDRKYKEGMLKNDGERLGLSRDRALMDKMGQGQYFKDPATGETVFGIPVMTKNGLTYQKVDLKGLQPIMRGKAGTPHKVEPEGTIMDDGSGGRYKMGANGETHDVFAPAISERAKLLESHGLPKAASEAIEWGEDGRAIKFNYNYYDSNDPASMAKLRADYSTYGRRQVLGSEESAARRDQMDPTMYRAGLYRNSPLDRFSQTSALDRALMTNR